MAYISQPGAQFVELAVAETNVPDGQGWGDNTYRVLAPDFTGVAATGSVFPNAVTASDRWSDDTSHAYYSIDQATATADLSVDLASWPFAAPAAIMPGVITAAFAVVRSPDGDTITARWYRNGTAIGSAVTFANTSHKVVRLPDFQYHLQDWLEARTLTLRLSGGEAHISTILLVPRVTSTINAIDVIDGSAPATASVADTRSTSGGNVAESTLTATVASSAAKRMLLISPFPVLEDKTVLAFITRHDNPPTANAGVYFNFDGYLVPTEAIDYTQRFEVWKNGAQAISGYTGAKEFFVPYRTWGMQSHTGVGMAQNISNGYRVINDVDDYLYFETGDNVGIRAWFNLNASAASRARIDQVIVGRPIMLLELTSFPGTEDPVPCADTGIELGYQYSGPDTQGAFPLVDRGDLVTSFDGLIYDPSGALISTELGIANPWVLPSLSGNPTASGYKAFVRANLDDGSYAFVGWSFDLECVAAVSGALPLLWVG